jgi:hypothetical protein
MAARKNPHNGCFGTPPSVNFFSSVDEDASESAELDKDALEKEMIEKMQKHTVKGDQQPDGNLKQWTLSEFLMWWWWYSLFFPVCSYGLQLFDFGSAFLNFKTVNFFRSDLMGCNCLTLKVVFLKFKNANFFRPVLMGCNCLNLEVIF